MRSSWKFSRVTDRLCTLRPLLAVLCLLSCFVPGLFAQTQANVDFLNGYVGHPFLLRERGGLHDTEKIKKDEADHYNGRCDKAVLVKSAKFAKGTLQFDVTDVGLATPDGNTPADCLRADETRVGRVLISGFNGQESQSDLQLVIDRVLQTPEAYLTSPRCGAA